MDQSGFEQNSCQGPDDFDDFTPEQRRLDAILRSMPDIRQFDEFGNSQPEDPVTDVFNALEYLRDPVSPHDPAYPAACKVITSRRDLLPYRQFITVPSELSDRESASWEYVRAYSDSTCGCGSERVIEPLNPRLEFEASPLEPLTVGVDEQVHIRPHGAPRRAAYTTVGIIGTARPALHLLPNPYSGSVNFSAPFGNVIELTAVEAMLVYKVEPLAYTQKGIPILAVTEVDVQNGTATFQLDSAVESFNPNNELPHED